MNKKMSTKYDDDFITVLSVVPNSICVTVEEKCVWTDRKRDITVILTHDQAVELAQTLTFTIIEMLRL